MFFFNAHGEYLYRTGPIKEDGRPTFSVVQFSNLESLSLTAHPIILNFDRKITYHTIKIFVILQFSNLLLLLLLSYPTSSSSHPIIHWNIFSKFLVYSQRKYVNVSIKLTHILIILKFENSVYKSLSYNYWEGKLHASKCDFPI